MPAEYGEVSTLQWGVFGRPVSATESYGKCINFHNVEKKYYRSRNDMSDRRGNRIRLNRNAHYRSNFACAEGKNFVLFWLSGKNMVGMWIAALNIHVRS